MSLTNYDNTRYSFFSKSQGEVIIPEPIGYLDGNGNIYERDKKSKGFLKTKSNKLEFFGAGYKFLEYQMDTKGVVEDVLMIRRIKSTDRLDERWRIASKTYLNLSKLRLNRENNTATTDAAQGGLYNLLDKKLNDQVDIVSTASLGGADIGTLKTVNLRLDPREIFLRSVGVVEPGEEISAVVSGGDGLNARTFPFKFDINSDRNNIQSAFGDQLSAANGNYATVTSDKVANLTILNVDTNKNLILNGRVKATIINAQPGSCTLDSVFYNNGESVNFYRKVNLDSCNPGVNGDYVEYVFNNYELNLNKGDSWTIGLLSDTLDGIRYRVDFAELEITENSGENLVGSTIRAIKPIDLAKRLVAKITGDTDQVISNILDQNGELYAKLISQGFWIRGFPDIIKEGTDEERKIQFKTSLEEFLDHLNALRPIAWWIEEKANKEYLRIEELEYTMQNFIGIRYSEFIDGKHNYIKTDKLEYNYADNNFYSKLIFGSDKGGEGYEEVFGLQSISGKAEFSTINDKVDSEYSALSPYALGDIDAELPRRRPFSDYPDEDTQYDSIINCFDCKIVNGSFVLKKWQDSYENQPTGLYRAGSAYNLEFTPTNLLKRHSFVINSGLFHHPYGFINFASSNCNSSFRYKRAGEVYIQEDQPIPHSYLDKAKFIPKIANFSLKVTQQIEDQIVGVNSSGVQNRFGLVYVLTDDGMKKMRLVYVDTNKEGKHKLIEVL